MKQDPFSGVYRALSPKELAEMLMNPNAPKTEAEHWAAREIEKLRAENARLIRERDAARAEVERLRAEMRKIEYLDRPQVRGLPRRVTIQQIALDALAGGKDD